MSNAAEYRAKVFEHTKLVMGGLTSIGRKTPVSDKADDYCRRADACSSRAYSARDPDVERQYLEPAEGWLKLARHAEEWLTHMKREAENR